MSLLDAFDLPLAARAAGLTHEAPALRLIERPFVRQDPFGLWPYHLHGLIRSTFRDADDHADDRWSPRDWHQAAQRTLTALGEEWTVGTSRDRRLLVGCLRQGLAIARDYNLDLDWLTDAAWTYVGDSVWEPVTPPSPRRPARPPTPSWNSSAPSPAASTSTALAPSADSPPSSTPTCCPSTCRRWCSTTGPRPCATPAEPPNPAATTSRLPTRAAARRGLAHAARLAGDFPTALATAQNLGWEGRHQRVLGDLYWLRGQPERAAAAYLAGRTEAEQHGKAGEAAHSQALRAFAIALYAPDQATAEIDLAHQLLTGLNLRATTINVRRAELIRDAGSDSVDDQIATLRTELDIAGLTSLTPAIELACAFHQAVLDGHTALHATLARLREQTSDEDHAYFVDIAQFMADVPVDQASGVRWLDSEQHTRSRWRALVIARQTHPHAGH
ncbi:hypothetical protein ACFXG9_41365 [Streptomyces mirabilis]|uniref:hypothetical protein n=1 Tax=Streptomyces mirabilis TaxID=68239 RepID=UPI00367898F4